MLSKIKNIIIAFYNSREFVILSLYFLAFGIIMILDSQRTLTRWVKHTIDVVRDGNKVYHYYNIDRIEEIFGIQFIYLTFFFIIASIILRIIATFCRNNIIQKLNNIGKVETGIIKKIYYNREVSILRLFLVIVGIRHILNYLFNPSYSFGYSRGFFDDFLFNLDVGVPALTVIPALILNRFIKIDRILILINGYKEIYTKTYYSFFISIAVFFGLLILCIQGGGSLFDGPLVYFILNPITWVTFIIILYTFFHFFIYVNNKLKSQK